jgi:hypothetical protein
VTDKEKLLALLGEWGVPSRTEDDNTVIVQVLDDSGKVGGYSGFFTAFDFDEDGTFVQMGAWE